jgi:hypothetical protein
VAEQPTPAEVTQAAPQGTPATVEPVANELESKVAQLEKRARDTEEALKEKQRLLHETTGRLAAEREMAERYRTEQFRMSPEMAQKQREEFLEQVRLDPVKAVEWAERNMQGQAQWMQNEIATLRNQFTAQLEDFDPVVQRNRETVERLKSDPEFSGLSKKALASLAEKFRTVTQPEPAKPPPAPTGIRRTAEVPKEKDVMPPAYRAWLNSQMAKNDTTIMGSDIDIIHKGVR